MKIKKLKGLRAENGYTQKDMSKFLTISKGSYYAKENGIQEFTLSEINTILNLFDRKYEEVFK